jgi:mannose-1-phosphate guanylyltransferase
MEHFYAVIMAGGGGTRLWPLSRRAKPKQMLRLFGEKTLFQMAVDRLLPIIPNESIFVVTVDEQSKQLKAQAPQIPLENFILEPMPRGTASVVGIAASLLNERDPESVMAILTSDHYIGDEEEFRGILSSAYEMALKGNLVTIGVKPTYPATGYGYIHEGEQIAEVLHRPVYDVKTFVEKPSHEIAEEYYVSGKYVWNSGMFIWKTEQILKEITRQMPELSNGLERIRAQIGNSDYLKVFSEVWDEIESETIDYGVMENAKNVCVIPAGNMNWFDIGSWDRFFDLHDVDSDGNLFLCKENIHIDTKNSMILQQLDVSSEKLVAVMGIEDLIVVDTDDVILICHRDRAEEVRSLVQALSKMRKDEFL